MTSDIFLIDRQDASQPPQLSEPRASPLAQKLELTVPLTLQVLRRSHATRNQKTPKDAQSHLGRRSIVTTMNVYAQEIPASVERDEAATLKGYLRVAPRCPQDENADFF